MGPDELMLDCTVVAADGFVGVGCTRLVLKFMFICDNVTCVHKPFAAVAQCIMNSFHGGQVFASEP